MNIPNNLTIKFTQWFIELSPLNTTTVLKLLGLFLPYLVVCGVIKCRFAYFTTIVIIQGLLVFLNISHHKWHIYSIFRPLTASWYTLLAKLVYILWFTWFEKLNKAKALLIIVLWTCIWCAEIIAKGGRVYYPALEVMTSGDEIGTFLWIGFVLYHV